MTPRQALAATGTLPKIKTFTTAERRQRAIEALWGYGKKQLPSLTEVERTHPDILDRLATENTILAPIVTAFAAVGDPVDPKTVGGIRAKLGLSQDDVDRAFCYCHNGAMMTGEQAAAQLMNVG